MYFMVSLSAMTKPSPPASPFKRRESHSSVCSQVCGLLYAPDKYFVVSESFTQLLKAERSSLRYSLSTILSPVMRPMQAPSFYQIF